MIIPFKLNGKQVTINTDPLRSLLSVLREDFFLMGAKQSCGEGECGACTVFLNGRSVTSCILPIAQVKNGHVVTIEALCSTPLFVQISTAFEQVGAVQCGFCIPGFVMSTIYFLKQLKDHEKGEISDKDIQKAFVGNFCRCTGYVKIIAAVRQVAHQKYEIPEVLYG